MSRDVYDGGHICYLNEVNRNAKAYLSMRGAYLTFSRSDVFRYDTRFGLPPGYFFNLDYLSDCARVCAAAENYLKARLLLDDKVIHEVKGHNHRTLGLMTIADLNKNHPFVYDSELGKNYIPELQNRTHGYERVLAEADRLGVPADVVARLERIRVTRNDLHFVEAEARDSSAGDIIDLGGFFNGKFWDELTELNAKLLSPTNLELLRAIAVPGAV